MTANLALRGYIAFSFIYLLCIVLGIENSGWLLKPLLLPFLIYAVYRAEYFPTKKKIMIALIFSWFGDVVLMFAYEDEMYFIIGLLLFLISHFFYIELFYKQRKESRAYRKVIFWLCCGVVLYYLVMILVLLLPKLNDLKIPVIIYAATISLMLIMALKTFFGSKNKWKYLVLIGAILFVVSDSLLAINKFYKPLDFASFWIMITYLIAQFSITLGILTINKKTATRLSEML